MLSSQVIRIVPFLVGLHITLAEPALSGTYQQILKPIHSMTEQLKNNGTPVNQPPNHLQFRKTTNDNGTKTFRSPLAEQIYAVYRDKNTHIQSPIIPEKGKTNLDEADNGDDVVVLTYEMEYGLVHPRDVNNLNDLQSHYTYIVLKANRDEEPENLTIHYWIGKYSKRANNGDAAAYSIRLDSNVHTRVKVHREIEGQESDAFKALFKQDKVEKASIRKADSENFEKKMSMFLINGDDHIYIKEVPPLTRNIPDSEKCMVYVSKKVHVFCAVKASAKKKEIAEKLAEFVRQKRGINEREVIFHQGDKSMWEVEREERQEFTRLLDEIESIPTEIAEKPIDDNLGEFTRSELRKILGQTTMTDDGEELCSLEVIRFYADEDAEIVEEEQTSVLRLPLAILDPHDSYLIDSCSNLGIFVWIGKKSDSRVRMECAKKAELQLLNKSYNYTMPITFVDPEDLSPGIEDVQDMIHFLNSGKLQSRETSRAIDQPVRNLKLEDDVFKFGSVRQTTNKPKENLESEYIETPSENEKHITENLLERNSEYESEDIKETTDEPFQNLQREGAAPMFEYLKYITGQSNRSVKKLKQADDEITTKTREQVTENSTRTSKSGDETTQVKKKPVKNVNPEDDASHVEAEERTANKRLEDNVPESKPVKKTRKQKAVENVNLKVDTSESAVTVKKKSNQSIQNTKSEYNISEITEQEPRNISKLEYNRSISEPTKKYKKPKSVKNLDPKDVSFKTETVRKTSIKNLIPEYNTKSGDRGQPTEKPIKNLSPEDNGLKSKSVKKVKKQKSVENLNANEDGVSKSVRQPTNMSISDHDTSEDGKLTTEEPISTDSEVMFKVSSSTAAKQSTKKSISNLKLKNSESTSEVVQPTKGEPVRRRGRPRKNKSEE